MNEKEVPVTLSRKEWKFIREKRKEFGMDVPDADYVHGWELVETSEGFGISTPELLRWLNGKSTDPSAPAQ